MAITREQMKKLMEPGLRKIFFEGYDELPEQYTQVFRVNRSEKAAEHDYHVIGLGPWNKFTGTVEYEDIEPGLEVNYVHEQYAKGMQIPIDVAEDDLYGVISENGRGGRQARALGRGARVTVEMTAASVLNDAFTKTGYDGVPLVSDAHPLLGTNGETASNKLTEALSEASLKQARLLMRRQVNDKGIKIQANGDTLVVPADLEYTALEITQSDQKPGTDLNDVNVVGKRIRRVIVLDYLEDPNNWFLLDSSLHQLNFFWRVRPEFRSDEDIDHLRLRFVGRCRFSVGYSDWRGVVGSAPA